ncbi:MAG: hypothetical protein Q8K58_13340 [Acidimicrobiales bacterium]|nr:hypothetical protein [Acidimicrobiales bacterium]
MEQSRPVWAAPTLIRLTGSADARNNISGTGDVDATYSGFPYGYS